MRPTDTSAQQRPGLIADERGVVAVELALLLPLILGILFLIIDFGRAFNYANDANQIAAEGARMAAVDGYPGSGALAAQGDTPELRSGSNQVTQRLRVCVDFPTNPVTGTSGRVGDPVHVRATATFRLIPIISTGNVPIHGDATMRLERAPSFPAGCSS